MKILSKKMLLRWNKANHTTGMTGVLCAAAIVSTCGMSPVLWSFLMAATVGLGLYWMASWPQCIPVAVLKVDPTLLVRVLAIHVTQFLF